MCFRQLWENANCEVRSVVEEVLLAGDVQQSEKNEMERRRDVVLMGRKGRRKCQKFADQKILLVGDMKVNRECKIDG